MSYTYISRQISFVFAASFLLASCTVGEVSDVDDSTDDDDQTGCEALTCEGLGKNCGDILDGCGATLDCGDCSSGKACGGGGIANVCGSGTTCVPTTCVAEGKECGSISNGCDAVIACGTCTGNETCVAATNLCEAPSSSCTATTTCTAEGRKCGTLFDGCITQSCGACDSAETCSTAGVCVTPGPSTLPLGWLYTSGASIYQSNGQGGGTRWIGRGVNINDVFQCGANSDPDDAAFVGYLDQFFDEAITVWKANFIRVVLDMSAVSYEPDPDWTGAYKTTMEAAIKRVSREYPNVYLLLTPYSHYSMAAGDPGDQATFYPTEETFAFYRKLVDSFYDTPNVIFALTNEGGGMYFNSNESAQAALWKQAIAAIREQENTHTANRHLIAVQGSSYTGDLTYYEEGDIFADDHILYECHYYPNLGSSVADYTHPKIPVFIGEYGYLDEGGSTTAGFYADVDSKQLSNLAWIMDAWEGYCQPTILKSTGMSGADPIQPNATGTQVMSYLQSHAAP